MGRGSCAGGFCGQQVAWKGNQLGSPEKGERKLCFIFITLLLQKNNSFYHRYFQEWTLVQVPLYRTYNTTSMKICRINLDKTNLVYDSCLMKQTGFNPLRICLVKVLLYSNLLLTSQSIIFEFNLKWKLHLIGDYNWYFINLLCVLCTID